MLVTLLVVVHFGQFDRVVADLVLLATEREIHLEDGLERLPMVVVLHQRGGEGVLEGLSILDRDVPDRLHRVEILSEADRQAGGPQLDDEPVQQVEDRIADALRGGGSVLGQGGVVGDGHRRPPIREKRRRRSPVP